jgi:hypothetical protein
MIYPYDTYMRSFGGSAALHFVKNTELIDRIH